MATCIEDDFTEVTLRLQRAGCDRVTDGMCLDELQIYERSRESRSSGVQEVEPMKREVSYEKLERMSLESLLYHVLVGAGRLVKEPTRT